MPMLRRSCFLDRSPFPQARDGDRLARLSGTCCLSRPLSCRKDDHPARPGSVQDDLAFSREPTGGLRGPFEEGGRECEDFMSAVFLDESGYTGTRLLDSAQPIFALASHNLSEEE